MMWHFQGADVVNGIHTDFVFTEFSDRWFIIMSQFEKLGTLVCIILLLFIIGTMFCMIAVLANVI